MKIVAFCETNILNFYNKNIVENLYLKPEYKPSYTPAKIKNRTTFQFELKQPTI